MRYQTISYESEMKPAIAAKAAPSPGASMGCRGEKAGSCGSSANFERTGRKRHPKSSAPTPTITLTAAAVWTVPLIISTGIVNLTAARQAKADPTVFTK
jgi:hypothetical protein